MSLYLVTVQLRDQPWTEDIITRLQPANSSLLLWNAAELNKFYSGEYSWKKAVEYQSYKCPALQYINARTVRMLIRTEDGHQASLYAVKLALCLKPKREPKKFRKAA